MGYRHILVAVDFSEASYEVAQRAVELARRDQANMTLLHVVDYLPPLTFADDFTPAPALMVDENELLERGKASLEKYAARLQLGDDTPRRVLIGVPKQEIVRAAEDLDVDLIVIGSHGRHGLGRLLGSTARAVLNDAACDVLAVRIKD